ncbi:transposase [Streptomyces sp. NBC_00287]|uniref:Tn3 family transposase n=1 Tax=Streptomyces sp. NBC_00287 TaxID=2975702 RepID=UPI002E2E3235|nr:Tn3 family transposase [Streptomyces sp. NBC_00287]
MYAVKYLSDEGYGRKIARQLNKGESIHSLRPYLHYAAAERTDVVPDRRHECRYLLAHRVHGPRARIES